jgi:hypothetical protein
MKSITLPKPTKKRCGPKCLRCKADSSWIDGHVPDSEEIEATKALIRGLKKLCKERGGFDGTACQVIYPHGKEAFIWRQEIRRLIREFEATTKP